MKTLNYEFLKQARPTAVEDEFKEMKLLEMENASIDDTDALNFLPNLKFLSLKNNEIKKVHNLNTNLNIWGLDFSNNKIDNLEDFPLLPALGFLDLSGNNLDFPQLSRLKDMQILVLSISKNNPKIEHEPHMREKLICLLPRVWVLDGIFVSTLERKRALSAHAEFIAKNLLPNDNKTTLSPGEFQKSFFIKFSNVPKKEIHESEKLKFLMNDFSSNLLLNKKIPIRSQFSLFLLKNNSNFHFFC